MAVTNCWDALNRLTGVVYPDGTTTSNLYTRGAVKILDLTATKDRLDHWTYFGYDSLRRKVAETNANSVITRYGFCDCGAVANVTNAWNTAVEMVTTFTYDYQGNRIFTTYPDAIVTNWFDSLQRPLTTCDSWGCRYLGYDNLGRVTSITNGIGAVERSTIYDVLDRSVYVTDANGVMTTNIYDALGRLLTRGYPDGGVEKFGYSARGLFTYTNQMGSVTGYGYDAARRKTSETNANTEIIRYTYNSAGDLLTLVDGKNQTNTWSYDLFGRVTNKLDQALVEILRYKYDADNRLTNRWSAAKGDTFYKYDDVGNLTNVDYAASTDLQFAYDALNRLTNMVDAAGTTKYTYAAGGQLFTEDGPFADDTVTNIYSNRLRTGLSLKQPVGLWTNGFSYDAAKNLSEVRSRGGSFTYVGGTAPWLLYFLNYYDPDGNYLGYIYNSEHDANGRLKTSYLLDWGDFEMDEHFYAYNKAGQRTNEIRLDASSVAYTYDPIGQLKVANSSVNTEDRGYLYDAAWNLNRRTNNGTPETFTVDNKNQLTMTPGDLELGYDGNGNRTNWVAGSYSYYYDDENQLIAMDVETAWRSEFTYDGKMRLRKRVDYNWDSEWVLVSETRYIYDGMRVIQERNESNVPTVSYTRGNDKSGSLEGAGGIGGLLGRTAHSGNNGTNLTHAYYYADGNGNITYMFDTNLAMVASYRYDPFGNTIGEDGDLADINVYRFSSKEFHANSGLYYYGYRWYDPNLQRWVNRDPIAERGGINLYGFVQNSPLTHYDAGGLIAFPDCATAQAAVLTAVQAWENNQTEANEAAIAVALAAAAIACSNPPPPPQPPPEPYCPPKDYRHPEGPRPPECSAGTVATAVGVTAAGYIIYRCVRMLPSLLPPLWPTIPINAVTP
jgi:RHS repeat-associated protein